MGDKDKKINFNEEDLNIFDDFNTNENLKKEIEDLRDEKKRDIYFYAINIGSFFKIINLLLFLSFSLMYIYFYIQDNEDLYDSNILNPVCGIFLGDNNSGESSCSSISYALKNIKQEKEKLKKDQFIKIIEIIPKVYSSINWLEGEEITFLLNKTKNKLRPMKIIEDFDIMKNTFEPGDKRKLECSDITIRDDYILDVSCIVKTRGYENKIVGFDGGKGEKALISGTSISLAASFLNFIEKKSAGKFTLIDPQKTFSSGDSDLEQGYSKQTSFKLKLLYNTDNLLLKK